MAGRTEPPSTRTSSAVRERGARHVLGLRRSDHGLPARAQQLCEQVAARGVQLGHHVVQQHERSPPAPLRQQAALGEQQREQGRALLALRPVGPQRRAAEEQLQLVPVGPVGGEAALEVRRAPLTELGRQPLGVAGG